jgi:hypothetical protein
MEQPRDRREIRKSVSVIGGSSSDLSRRLYAIKKKSLQVPASEGIAFRACTCINASSLSPALFINSFYPLSSENGSLVLSHITTFSAVVLSSYSILLSFENRYDLQVIHHSSIHCSRNPRCEFDIFRQCCCHCSCSSVPFFRPCCTSKGFC